jgi:hypothetical protein
LLFGFCSRSVQAIWIACIGEAVALLVFHR